MIVLSQIIYILNFFNFFNSCREDHSVGKKYLSLFEIFIRSSTLLTNEGHDKLFVNSNIC